MKIKLLLLAILVSIPVLFAQQNSDAKKIKLQDGTMVTADKLPETIKPVRPVYPPEAIEKGIQGIVFINVVIDEKGMVSNASVSKGINSALDNAALDAVKQMEFSPAIYKNTPVKAEIIIPVKFRLDSDKEFEKLTPEKGEKPPAPIEIVKPEYPEEAKLNHIEGTVYLRVLIDTQGNVTKTEIVKSTNKLFEEAAKAAILKTQFTPAIQKGKKISAWVNIPFKFTLHDKKEHK